MRSAGPGGAKRDVLGQIFAKRIVGKVRVTYNSESRADWKTECKDYKCSSP
jgi:hypothetical protein